MKPWLVIFLLFSQSSCDDQSKAPVFPQSTLGETSDTLCVDDKRFAKLRKIQLVDACQILFSDSISTKFEKSMGANTLPAEYNYNNNSLPLKYQRVRDTIEVKILQLVRSRSRIVVDTIFVKQDSVFLREKSIGVKKELSEFVCEEFRYTFIVSSYFQPVIFRFYPEMKKYFSRE